VFVALRLHGTRAIPGGKPHRTGASWIPMIIFRKLGSLALGQMAGDRVKDLLLLAENHLTTTATD
jgi:hypothetical protein